MNTRVITFANQKGGIGKSTLTVFTATLMHFSGKSKVAVFDCDYQQSLVKQRRMDLMEAGDEAPEGLFPVVGASPEEAVELLKDYNGQYDYIFLDMPGSIGQANLLNLYLVADVVVIPIVANKLDFNSTLEFIKFISDLRRIKQERFGLGMDIFLLMNKFTQKTENKFVYEKIKGAAEALDMQVLTTVVRNYVAFDRNLSTLKPLTDQKEAQENLDALVKELTRKLTPNARRK